MEGGVDKTNRFVYSTHTSQGRLQGRYIDVMILLVQCLPLPPALSKFIQKYEQDNLAELSFCSIYQRCGGMVMHDNSLNHFSFCTALKCFCLTSARRRKPIICCTLCLMLHATYIKWASHSFMKGRWFFCSFFSLFWRLRNIATLYKLHSHRSRISAAFHIYVVNQHYSRDVGSLCMW